MNPSNPKATMSASSHAQPEQHVYLCHGPDFSHSTTPTTHNSARNFRKHSSTETAVENNDSCCYNEKTDSSINPNASH